MEKETAVRLDFLEKGSGEALILLHGNGEDKSYFANQIDFFAKTFRVIALDTRGHGRSPRGSGPFTIRQFAEDLRAFMDLQNIKKANILGFSDGGNIALLFAINHPERVDRLILNGANLDAAGVRLSVQIPIVAGYTFASFFSKFSASARKKAEMLGLMVFEPNLKAEALQNIQAKTLVIAGTKDMIKRRHTLKIYESLPDARLALIPGGHFIANREPAAFNRAVETFLTADRAT